MKEVEAIYPLSPSQQGMLFQSLAGRGSGVHIEQTTSWGVSDFDPALFELAWADVSERHPVLRTAFSWTEPTEPLQVVFRRTRAPLRRLDWADHDPAGFEAEARRQLEEERLRGFDPSRAPLIRIVWIRGPGGRGVVSWIFHHVILDGWCVPILQRECELATEARREGRRPVFPPARPYRDYIRWLKAQPLSEAERYWRAQLAGFREATPLGDDAGPGEGGVGTGYGHVSAVLDAASSERLRRRARERRVSLSTLTHGLWGALLASYSGRSDVVFGATVSGRPPELDGVESMVGLFINTLPIRVAVDFRRPVWAWLDELQKAHLDRQRFEYCSSGQIQDWAGAPRGRPLYESLLVFENLPGPDSRSHSSPIPGPDPPEGVGAAAPTGEVPLEVTAIDARGAETGTALTLVIRPGERILLEAVFQRARVEEPDARRILADVVAGLNGASADPAATVGDWVVGARSQSPPRVRSGRRDATGDRPAVAVAARDWTEHRLVALWEELLGVAPLGVTDSLFEIGGHSLVALQLRAEVEKRFGQVLHLTTLFENPTIEALAGVLRRQQKREWSPLVLLRPGGSRPALFCIHPLGGGVLTYTPLAARWKGAEPLYGLQARGLEPGQSPAEGLGPMAADYLQAMRAAQPTGPYHLLGLSFGGLVAFEMATQLAQSGEAVGLVALLDTPSPRIVPTEMRECDDESLLYSIFSVALPLSLEALRGMCAEDRVGHVLDLAKAAHVLPPDVGREELNRIFGVWRSYYRAAMDYEPRYYPGELTLIRAEEDSARVSSDAGLGWASEAARLTIRWVPGRHETMDQEPHVAQLAAVIHERLSALGGV